MSDVHVSLKMDILQILVRLTESNPISSPW
ncbi:hypothetical protein VIBNISFn118_230062 [Vibrio nigripulchritudo SFn118]|nr:hypothetical protein VIBNISFn118_230062 [Vibrio nigripulchritudo SFn118]